MLKKTIAISVAVLLGCYILFATIYFGSCEKESVCQDVHVNISDDKYTGITAEEIHKLLKDKKLHPLKKAMNTVDCSLIEQALNKLSVIADCQCYKTHKETVGIDIKCKKPIMQIFCNNGEQYLIDKNGDIIEGVHSALYLPVASGNIDRNMAKEELLTLALFLQETRFWSEQIEQIHFTQKKEIILVPRVGNHTIELGNIKNIEGKLEKLRAFYEKGLNKIGWNKYSKLNIEFDNKVIGTKK